MKTPREKRHMSHDLIKDMCLFSHGVFIRFESVNSATEHWPQWILALQMHHIIYYYHYDSSALVISMVFLWINFKSYRKYKTMRLLNVIIKKKKNDHAKPLLISLL